MTLAFFALDILLLVWTIFMIVDNLQEEKLKKGRFAFEAFMLLFWACFTYIDAKKVYLLYLQ